jgi:hypothetical protein
MLSLFIEMVGQENGLMSLRNPILSDNGDKHKPHAICWKIWASSISKQEGYSRIEARGEGIRLTNW